MDINSPSEEQNVQQANEEKGRKLLTSYLKYSFAIILLGVTFWSGFQFGKKESGNCDSFLMGNSFSLDAEEFKDRGVDFVLFWQVWDILKEKYVDAGKLDAKKLMYSSINGMLSATGDPYTVFLDPERNKEFNEEIEGRFEGIGAEIGLKKGILTVISPLEGSPAEKAGLRAGDKILKINGESTAELGIDDCVKKMRGEKGTNVALTIFRNNGSETTEDIVITRDVINVKSVSAKTLDGGIYQIKISRFGDDTSKEFFQAVLSMPKNSKGIILDMRNNPGGYLQTAVEIAGSFLPKDSLVVMEEDKDGRREKLYTDGGNILKGIPVIVLINEGSASASEILAGALRENRDDVKLVGKQSFGKGSVQELINLPQESAVKITIAKWLTPKGNQINDVGIAPDVAVDYTLQDYQAERDPQLNKALEMLRK